jgi:hypothetical protein
MTTHAQAVPQNLSARNLMAGLLAIVTVLGVAVTGLAYGARWLGLTHFGGIVEEVTFTGYTAYSPPDPLPLIVAVEKKRGWDRYEKTGIRGHVYVATATGEQMIGIFYPAPAGHKWHRSFTAEGAIQNLLPSESLDEYIPLLREAGEIRVVVDELEDGEVVNAGVAELTIPVSLKTWDSVRGLEAAVRTPSPVN